MGRMPFTADEFFGVFGAYNHAIWPAQLVLIAAAVAAVVLAFRGGRRAGPWIAGFLAALWAWAGIAYHLLHFRAINPAAMLFGAAFVVQAVLFLWWGVVRGGLDTAPGRDARTVTGGIILLYALAVYPLLGRLVGHAYLASPTFGAPCPVVLYTFGLLLLARRVPMWLLIVPTAWAVVGTSAVFAFGVLQDAGLIMAALVTLPMLLYRRAPGGVGPAVPARAGSSPERDRVR